MATDDQTVAGGEDADREDLIQKLLDRDFERHRDIYEKLEDE